MDVVQKKIFNYGSTVDVQYIFRERLKMDIKNGLREEIKKELLAELREEIKRELKEELRKELYNEIKTDIQYESRIFMVDPRSKLPSIAEEKINYEWVSFPKVEEEV